MGDLVVVPLRFIREIAVGEITGEYRWTTDYGPDMPHVRDVEWFMTDAPRDAFPPDLLFSFGGSMSVCSVTRNNAEFRVRALDVSASADSDVQLRVASRLGTPVLWRSRPGRR